MNINAELKDKINKYVNLLIEYEQQREDINSSIRDLYQDIKNNNLDSKAIKRLVKYSTSNKEEIDAQEEIFQIYKDILEKK